MNSKKENRLDNPVWFSLNETHERFSISYNNLKCYDPSICTFGGFIDPPYISSQIDKYAKACSNFYIVGNKPNISNNLILNKELVCLQMTLNHEMDLPIEETIIKLNMAHEEAMYDLVNLVQPGYFKSKTSLLGDYYGIFKSGKLVAITGERLKMEYFTELSAIVTHPNYTGKGYAKQLIAYVSSNIFHQKKLPYLHVSETNLGAIRLYQKLGFSVRRKISFWNFMNEG